MAHNDFRAELNEEQLAVVEQGDGACLVLAGAGSGKTRVITYRVAWLIERGVAPESILLLTFTNKAAREMLRRIQELVGSSASGVFGGTFHGVANRLLRSQATRLGYQSNFSILDQEDAKSLIKSCIKESGADKTAGRFPSASVVMEIGSYARNALVTRAVALAKLHPKLEPALPDIQKVLDRYEQKKKAANALDFDDLLVKWLELLEGDPQLRQAMSDRFAHVLVDEFQDTNALQNAIVRRLAPPGHNLLVVGDDAQSIYSFRAADVRNILDFPKAYPGARVMRLTVNYRSTPEILDLANDVISHNVEQFPKELKAVQARLKRPIVVPAASAAKEAEFIVERIGELQREGVPAQQIAVLFRATFHSQALEFELVRRGIAYEYRGGLRFFDRAHVKDALAYLRLVANPADAAAWLRLLGEQRGIGDTTAVRAADELMTLGSFAKATIMVPGAVRSEKATAGWLDLRQTLEAVLKATGPAAVLRAVVKSPYADYLENEYPNWRERLDELEQLAKFADGYERPEDFLAEVTLDDSLAGSSRDGQGRLGGPRLVLSTVHQAKGLEWDAVFVMHLSASSFPNRNALMEKGGLEEERRLFYVAVTRARKFLILSHPATVGRDIFAFEGPSTFLEEVDPNCLENGGGCRTDGWDSSGADDFGAEESIEIGEDGERRTPSIAAVKRRMSKLKPGDDAWRKRSFLG